VESHSSQSAAWMGHPPFVTGREVSIAM